MQPAGLSGEFNPCRTQAEMCMWKWFSILICSSVQHGVIPPPNEFNGTWSYLACKTAFSDRISPWFSEVLQTCVYLVLFWWLNLSVTVIPYHITVTTGTEYDSSTDSRVYIIIMGQKVKTERLWLDLPEGKDEFADGSVEKFSVWGLDVGEIKKVEVLCECSVSMGGIWNAWPRKLHVPVIVGDRKTLGSEMNVNGDVLMRFHIHPNLKEVLFMSGKTEILGR